MTHVTFALNPDPMTGSGDGRTECKQDPSRVFLPLAKETADLTTSFRGRQRANLGCRKVLVVFFEH